jgi:abortive infection bacteriophage resistance protein
MEKPTYTVTGQITLLKRRGMLFRDEAWARKRLQSVSYYRLRDYWQDCQVESSDKFEPDTYFEDIMFRYEFDRKLRFILFSGIEQIEIAIRTKVINLLSASYGELWYLNRTLFETSTTMKDGIIQTAHLHTISKLQEEFNRALEVFTRERVQPAEAWKLMEIASFGTLVKLYKCLHRNLRERGLIAKELGVNSPRVFFGWLESIALIRNMIAHHSRLWNRVMEKSPRMQLKNPCGAWFTRPLHYNQISKPFSTISCIVYLCNHLTQSDELKHQILSLIKEYPAVPIYKYGFFNHWEREPIWREGK